MTYYTGNWVDSIPDNFHCSNAALVAKGISDPDYGTMRDEAKFYADRSTDLFIAGSIIAVAGALIVAIPAFVKTSKIALHPFSPNGFVW